MPETRVVILGGGPAGVGGAYRLRRQRKAAVTLVEQRNSVGGNAGSFEFCGHRMDYGSHRLHPACDPEVLADIRQLLGDDLVERPRHGRIRLGGRWIHFPLRPLDLVRHLDPALALGALRDAALAPLRAHRTGSDSFAEVLAARLGPTICNAFYFPYARKIWGQEPTELAAVQAQRRVSAGSLSALGSRLFGAVRSGGPRRAGRYFYYPRKGYGQISEAYAAAAETEGAELLVGWTVTAVRRSAGIEAWQVVVERNGARRVLGADHVWSTLPISVLARLVDPAPPPRVQQAGAAIDYRAMILVYLELPVERFTEFDAHYFPGPELAMTRLSEPKNYAGRPEPAGRTALCAELPCAPDDAWWEMEPEELAALVAQDLSRAELALPVSPTAVHVRRLRYAYPIYARGYEQSFAILDDWVSQLPGIVTYGRQGLFAHDNTHHALYMAYAAADCLVDGRFDEHRWSRYRDIFATHVVED